jgi:hypothetical protein
MHAADFSSIAANLLALFLSVAWPVWDYFATQSLKANPVGQRGLIISDKRRHASGLPPASVAGPRDSASLSLCTD